MDTTKKPTYILGLSAFYHDSSACLLKDGVLIAAAAEERFSRKKHDNAFPHKAIAYCLQEAGITLEEVAAVAFYEKPLVKFDRILHTYLSSWPKGFWAFSKAMKAWLGEKLWMEHLLKKHLKSHARVKKVSVGKFFSKEQYTLPELYYIPHHISHAASAFYASQAKKATLLVVDAVGEWSCSSMGEGVFPKVTLSQEMPFPHSVGLLYSAFTYYLGFRVNSGEYKVMGLAPYGTPQYKEKIYELLARFPDGSFALKTRYFAFTHDVKMISRDFETHFGAPRRDPESALTDFHKDLAASIQEVTEELLLTMIKKAYERHPHDTLCLAGGVALNCVANERILREGPFKKVFIFPASGDDGGSVGAAWFLHYHLLEKPRPQKTAAFPTVYLGPGFSRSSIASWLEKVGISYEAPAHPEKVIADFLAENAVIGLFSGRMEFGPRALGARSIIADPRKAENWQRVNLKIKFRESFRPFAPTVLQEKASEYFDLPAPESPYMLLTSPVKVKYLPAITHVNNSARVQTLSRDQHPFFYKVIYAFYEKTGCPVVINTSFNVRGEPIVCTPEDALRCFLHTDMDVLVLEGLILKKSSLKSDLKRLKKRFPLKVFDTD